MKRNRIGTLGLAVLLALIAPLVYMPVPQAIAAGGYCATVSTSTGAYTQVATGIITPDGCREIVDPSDYLCIKQADEADAVSNWKNTYAFHGPSSTYETSTVTDVYVSVTKISKLYSYFDDINVASQSGWESRVHLVNGVKVDSIPGEIQGSVDLSAEALRLLPQGISASSVSIGEDGFGSLNSLVVDERTIAPGHFSGDKGEGWVHEYRVTFDTHVYEVTNTVPLPAATFNGAGKKPVCAPADGAVSAAKSARGGELYTKNVVIAAPVVVKHQPRAFTTGNSFWKTKTDDSGEVMMDGDGEPMSEKIMTKTVDVATGDTIEVAVDLSKGTNNAVDEAVQDAMEESGTDCIEVDYVWQARLLVGAAGCVLVR